MGKTAHLWGKHLPMKQLLFLPALALTIGFQSQTASAQCPIVPFAVVELFTSHGCSYCPDAEEALDSVIQAEKTSGRNVICIAEHVTYWNGSWFDPFSDPQFSPRQTVYCQYMGVPKGTPEAFVNGKMIVAPSPTIPGINAAINTQLAAVASAGVCLTLQSPANAATLSVAYDLSGNYAGKNLIVCLVEDGLVTTPNAGENQGVTLHEDGVSRKFVVTPISASSGVVSITPPANCVRAHSQIVAYVQNPTNMVIYGATRGIDLASATTGVQDQALEESVVLYPNPATSEVTIGGTFSEQAQYAICNLLGAELTSGAVGNGKISLNELAEGMYILKVSDGSSIFSRVLSKQ